VSERAARPEKYSFKGGLGYRKNTQDLPIKNISATRDLFSIPTE
jgi:hypothetical protein